MCLKKYVGAVNGQLFIIIIMIMGELQNEFSVYLHKIAKTSAR